MDGIINIYKEKGFTSHDVVAVVRKTLNQKKVGHTGTLDPDAEGVLPICLGKGTKISELIMSGNKKYRAEVTLGIETTTEDIWGEIISEKEVNFNENEIKNAVLSFIGDYYQTPPMYSAIKINGKKLYEIARKGQEIEREKRLVVIDDIEIISFNPPNKFVIDVSCHKGTYIRTLCRDIGEKLKCEACMSSLTRLKTGVFNIENAVKLDTLKLLAKENRLDEVIIPIDKVLTGYNKTYISQKGDKFLHNGGKVYEYAFLKTENEIKLDDETLVYDSLGEFCGIYKFTMDEEKNLICVKPVKVML